MKRILLIFIILSVSFSISEARSRLPQYGSTPTHIKMKRLEQKAESAYIRRQYNNLIERERIRTNELRRQDYIRNKAHNEQVLKAHKEGKRW